MELKLDVRVYYRVLAAIKQPGTTVLQINPIPETISFPKNGDGFLASNHFFRTIRTLGESHIQVSYSPREGSTWNKPYILICRRIV